MANELETWNTLMAALNNESWKYYFRSGNPDLIYIQDLAQRFSAPITTEGTPTKASDLTVDQIKLLYEQLHLESKKYKLKADTPYFSLHIAILNAKSLEELAAPLKKLLPKLTSEHRDARERYEAAQKRDEAEQRRYEEAERKKQVELEEKRSENKKHHQGKVKADGPQLFDRYENKMRSPLSKNSSSTPSEPPDTPSIKKS